MKCVSIEGRMIAEKLIQEREAEGVRWAYRARVVFLVVAGLSVPFTSPTTSDFIVSLTMVAVGLALAIWALRTRGDVGRLHRAGALGAAFDVLTLCLLPFSWWHAAGADLPISFLVKADQGVLASVMIAINALALRPLYPIAVASCVALFQAVVLVVAINDPGVALTTDPASVNLGDGVHVGFSTFRIIATLMLGLTLGWLARSARRLLREGVALEHENLTMQERQAELIAEGKMTALASLVAGIAHEVNTPLGVVRSSSSTLRVAGQRVRAAVAEAESIDVVRDDPKTSRALALLVSTGEAIVPAIDRIQGLVSSLKDFARLDEAERQRVDLRPGLESALDLIPEALKTGVTIDRELDDIPPFECEPKALNQVFMTLIQNALEASEGGGRVVLRTRRDEHDIVIEIADEGRGMAPAELAQIFDVRFAKKQGRVGMGLGLPMARRIVVQHGGKIDAVSTPEQGTRFLIRLPVGAPGSGARA